MLDVQRLRVETPGAAHVNHQNNAGAGLMPDPVVAAIHEHVDLEARIGGYEAHAAQLEAVEEARSRVAGLVGARPANVAFLENATVAFDAALSAVPFRSGDVVLTSRNDYISNQIAYLSLQARFGVEVVRAPDLPEGGVDPDAVRKLIHRRRPRLVAMTHVPTNSGLVQQLAPVGEACRERDVLFLVDACQSVGQVPVDVEALGCDFLSATGRKYLRGPRGSGFLYVSDGALALGLEPLFIDMRGAQWVAEDLYQPVPDARRFENWEFAYALVLGLGEAAHYAGELGIEHIEPRVKALAHRMRQGLESAAGVRVLDRGPELCGLVTAALDGVAPGDAVRALRRQGINTAASAREYAVLDFDEKGVEGALRLSPHYYNTEDEVDAAVAAVAALVP